MRAGVHALHTTVCTARHDRRYAVLLHYNGAALLFVLDARRFSDS